MSNALATFSGKIGDILWSLPTVRELGKRYGPMDFAVMPQYESLLGLLDAQDYIEHAFVIPEWVCWGSPHGDQPWEAPVEVLSKRHTLSVDLDVKGDTHMMMGYETDHVYHLAYRAHPGIGAPAMPLVDFIAHQQNLVLEDRKSVV